MPAAVLLADLGTLTSNKPEEKLWSLVLLVLLLLHHDETGLWGQMRDISAAVSCKTSFESHSGVLLLASL